MNYTPDYDLINTNFENASFVGMNTANGFVGLYKQLFRESELKRLYIIKGSAGCGKSTMMRRVSEVFKDKGYKIESYLCSSDPYSLDAVSIDSAVVILDGTAPHNFEMQYPIAASEIINLTNFTRSDFIKRKREEIIHLSNAKSDAFVNIYKHLKIMNELYKDSISSVLPAIDEKKISDSVERLFKSALKKNEKGNGNMTVIKSVGMRGNVRLDTLEKAATVKVIIRDVGLSAYIYMDHLEKALKSRGISYTISPDPITGKISDIFVLGCNVLFSISETDDSDKYINMSRFIIKDKFSDIKGVLKLNHKCIGTVKASLEENIKLAQACHFKLEDIYGKAMNFEAVNSYTSLLCDEISEILE